jgi:hypothetical protein
VIFIEPEAFSGFGLSAEVQLAFKGDGTVVVPFQEQVVAFISEAQGKPDAGRQGPMEEGPNKRALRGQIFPAGRVFENAARRR